MEKWRRLTTSTPILFKIRTGESKYYTDLSVEASHSNFVAKVPYPNDRGIYSYLEPFCHNTRVSQRDDRLMTGYDDSRT